MKKVTIATLAALFGFAGSALAQTPGPGEEGYSGLYLGGGWGQFNLDIDNLNDAGAAVSSIAKSEDNAWKLFVGYRVNPYLSFEAAYVDFGKPGDRFSATGSNGNYSVGLSGFAPYIIGTVPLGPIELFGKAGYYFYDVDARVNFDAPGPNIESKHSGNDFLYGGGIGFTVAQRLNLRAEYEVVDVDGAENSDAIWLTAAWRF